MTLNTAGKLIDAVIILLVIGYFITWFQNLSESVIGFIAAMAYILSYRFARKALKDPPLSYYLWMLLPTIVFIVVPFIWEYMRREESSVMFWLLYELPWTSLIIPVLLLIAVRTELKKREQLE